jgi:hypothetical protein
VSDFGVAGLEKLEPSSVIQSLVCLNRPGPSYSHEFDCIQGHARHCVPMADTAGGHDSSAPGTLAIDTLALTNNAMALDTVSGEPTEGHRSRVGVLDTANPKSLTDSAIKS